MKRTLLIAGAMLASALLGAGLMKLRDHLGSADPEHVASIDSDENASSPDDGTTLDTEPAVLTLSEDKLAAVSPRLEAVTEHSMRPFNVVPGRLRYDDRRHIEVRIATSGVLTTVLVKPGDKVQAGDILAELNSSEVGHARADVMQRESDLAVVTQRRDWEQTVCKGLQQLAAAIQSRTPLEKIRDQFAGISIGSAREKILTTYSQLLLAESLARAAMQNAATGVVPGKTLQERQSERDSAEASLQGTLEQLLFDARQTCRQAEIAVEDARRRLNISRQNVATLLGQSGSGEIAGGMDMDDENLSLVRIRAPFAATVEQKNFSASERVDVGESLFVLADTSTLWVAADLRDRDRAALSLIPGDSVDVFLSPSDAQPVSATVYFVGREVDPLTNAVPLVAELKNSDGALRPGMYVTVRVPLGPAAQALAIPESAIVEHDSQRFVFVPEGDAVFRRVNVTTGQSTGELVQITSGVTAGDRVVVDGAFVLKSELLLEREE